MVPTFITLYGAGIQIGRVAQAYGSIISGRHNELSCEDANDARLFDSLRS